MTTATTLSEKATNNMNRSLSKQPANSTAVAALIMLVVSGCATAPFSQDTLSVSVQVPAGNVVVLETVGTGKITYECRTKKDNAGFEWDFVGPDAKLTDRDGKQIGRYYGPPATWESSDGSIVTGAQVAVSPVAPGNIPLQLVKANPATGKGNMVGTTFIQRVATKGGIAPSTACDAAAISKKEIVNYRADYIFYKAK
jgi:hypothetical protein